MSPMNLSWHFLTLTKYEMVTVNECRHIYAPIVMVIKGPPQKIVVVHMKWWRSLPVIIINIRDGPWMSRQHTLSAMPPLVTFNFLVTEAIVYHHFSYEMVTVTIRHYRSLLVTDLECHHNTYTFGDATFGDESSFDPRQWAYGDIFRPSPKYEIVTVNECHYIYASIVTTMKVLSP